MTRSERMQPVQRAVGHEERELAGRLAESDRRLADAEKRLAELESYQAEYARTLGERVSAGISVTGLRDYQAFLARLCEAVRAQARSVAAMRAERDAAQGVWRTAAQRAKAIDQVVERWQAEERVVQDRKEQKDIDERALRGFSGRGLR